MAADSRILDATIVRSPADDDGTGVDPDAMRTTGRSSSEVSSGTSRARPCWMVSAVSTARHGSLLVALHPTVDVAFRREALIGAEGGTIETVDSTGVVMRLDVPAGALTQDTRITMTPLVTSPLAGDTGALHPGVTFEPEGLTFAVAATLTFDFTATNAPLAAGDAIFLLTSPLTMVPVYGPVDLAARTVTAHVRHFSALQPGRGQAALMDLRAWADPCCRAAT